MIDKGRGELALRALRLKQGRRGKERKLLDGVLGDEDARAIVAAALEDEYAPVRGEDAVGASETPIRDFIQFLLDNQDALIAFIKAIMELFQPT